MASRGPLKKGISLRLMGLSQSDFSYHPSVNRVARIRSSEWAAVWGVNPYLTRAEYWRVLKGKKRNSPPANLPCLAHGHREEPVTLSLFKKNYLPKGLVMTNFGAMQYFHDPDFIASPDSVLWKINDLGVVEAKSGVEAKNPWSKPIPTKVSPEWYSELAHRVLQCFLCMAIFKVPTWHLIYTKNLTKERALFLVHWNNDFWQGFLYPQARAFYDSTVPPPAKVKKEEKQANEHIIMTNIMVELIEYCPPICEED
jgi:hypothetical protein